MPGEKKPQVFLSYASENLDMVRKVYDGLVKRGLNVWFDKENLGPGKSKPQIERAIRGSRYFIIRLSNAAVKKTGDEPGFQDHELNEAYEIARNQPEQEFTIISIRLEDCPRGDQWNCPSEWYRSILLFLHALGLTYLSPNTLEAAARYLMTESAHGRPPSPGRPFPSACTLIVS